MGCDGGTIPKRCELVNEKKKAEKKDKNEEMKAKWNNCAISQLPLLKPIVACETGRLYNKESVIEFLLNKNQSDLSGSFSHLRGLKDVRELNLTDNSSYVAAGAEKVDHGELQRTSAASYACPIVGVEMNGKYRFVFLWECGCVFSERALKEVKGENCHKCGRQFKTDDIIVINGSPEDVEQLTKRMVQRRLEAKRDKKPKKELKPAAGSEAALAVNASEDQSDKHKQVPVVAADAKLSNRKCKPEPTAASGNDGPSTKKPRLEPAAAKGCSSVLPSAGRAAAAAPASSKLTSKCKTLQNDSSKSDAFKSLFTTHKTALTQEKPHWVTFNPQYF